MDETIKVKFIVDPDFDPNEDDIEDFEVDEFTIDFPKWNLPQINQQLVFLAEDDQLHFFAVIGKHYAIKDGKIKDFNYVVKKHGTPDEFDYLLKK